ncbi:MAG: succinate dehydrogenase, cytochrome b556 subunit [Pseudomonadota bacterium]|nr:succinate dehydrogenase, cytochrome b556 subunit [Pseudomonadota bacterium]
MKKQDLPLSPHLQIYKPQITSVLSIAHRITGFALNFTLLIFVIGLLSITLGEEYYFLFKFLINTIPAKIVLYLSILGFSYHLLNGFRHFFWDFGLFLEKKSSTILGYVILVLSLIISAIISICSGLFL